LKEWENENRQTSDLFAQNLREKIAAIKKKLERLTDAYLAEALELAEYQQTKNALMAEKKTKEEKLSDFERKGNHWLELTRNWILEANQAKNLALQENFSEMKNYLKKIGSNRRLARGRLKIDFKKPFDLLAKLPAEARAKGEGEAATASNSIW
jgi:vacuolar-type H+-ATPase subunit I/STV1